ncbi:hypothetical protein JCM19274_2973 [Algibacter lectus]|uniref:Uncharacterized protein n=1 Tax=Algibacter lectus TaxID=221126 RepID=A0A090WZT0_9FLAO|nr:hypothetical protein JCM19274_2973 [Algibacter lectus]
MFSILIELDSKYKQDISYKLYLEAKVLEIIAIQIENYKTLNTQKFNHIKKGY